MFFEVLISDVVETETWLKLRDRNLVKNVKTKQRLYTLEKLSNPPKIFKKTSPTFPRCNFIDFSQFSSF